MKDKRSMFLILVCMILVVPGIHSQSGPPWTGSNFGYNYIFRGIDFPSNQSDTGYACGESLTYQGNGIVVKTTDGGATWTQMWMGAGKGVEGASFVDVNTGYIAGWPKLGQGWSGFAKTTDGGATWTSVSVTNDIYFFTDVVFKDANNGILVGQTNLGAGVWATGNGGSTWSPGTGIVAIPQHLCYVSGNTYFLTDNDGHIQKSTNNGLSWTTVWDAGGSVYILGIDHQGDNTIMACGDYGLVVVSNDGGTTWSSQTIGTDIWHDFGWDSPNHVFVCGTPGLVYESWNGGETWQNANPQGAGQSALYECTFTSDYHGFICGSQGVLLKRDPSCGAGFAATPNPACTADSVEFSDESWGNISSWSWVFEGGTPPTSSDPDPVVIYNVPGTYDVTLTVSNPWWSNTLPKINYLSAAQSPPAPAITAVGYTLSSNVTGENQWYLNGLAIAGATGQTYEATASGLYWDVAVQGNCSSDTSNNIYLVMTGIPDVPGKDLVLSPVPNMGRFTVSMPGHPVLPWAVEVFNSQGVCIFSDPRMEIGGQVSKAIDLGNVPAGIYTLVASGSGRLVVRLMVAR
jgi:photosystem II stability/assembly factor-like uncharacterized protein